MVKPWEIAIFAKNSIPTRPTSRRKAKFLYLLIANKNTFIAGTIENGALSKARGEPSAETED
jgi:hypothetical protein